MDAPHRDSNPGGVEVQKRPLSASAQKESQKEHTQKPKGSVVMASVEPQVLFGGTPAGSEHAPPVEAVLTSTSNENDGPPRPSPQNCTAQQPAPQPATVLPSTANGTPVVPALQTILLPPHPPGPATTNQRQPAQHRAEPSAAGEGPPVEPSSQEDNTEDMWSPDHDNYDEFGDGTSNQVAIALSVHKFRNRAATRNASKLPEVEIERIKTLVDAKP